MGNYERRTGSPVSINFNSTGTATATCSAGRRVVGGGYTATNSQLDVIIVTANYPTADDTWTVSARFSYDFSSASITLTAYAICM
jgi:hypothetical protein